MAKIIEGKTRKITVNVTNALYERFKHKCYEEGYSMQKTLQLLMKLYVEDK